MKIASWNVNSLRVRLPQVLEWLESEQPDLLGLQELKMSDNQFPEADILAAGYQVVYSGQKTYNGVAILSKQGGVDIVKDIPGLDDPQRRVLAATYGDVRMLNLYIPNGQEVDSEKYAYKLDWLEKLIAMVADELTRHPKLVIVGDFNIAPDDRDVHDPDSWKGKILCSDKERQALQQLFDLGLTDTFRQFEQEEKIFSWWDYRMNGYRRNRGLRIDLVLATKALADHCSASSVDKVPRGWERPSDHAPVVATFS